MNKYLHIKMIIGCIFTFLSCVNNIGEEDSSSPILPSDMSVKITAKSLYKQIYSESCNEAIGLYILASSAGLGEEYYIENECFKCTTDGFSSKKPIYYPADTKCDIISYYPFKENGVESDKKSIQIEVQKDQSSIANYNHSDFMTASIKGLNPTNKIIDLAHEHRLCQLSIIIKASDETNLEDFKKSNPTVTINNAFCRATYDFETKQISSLNSPQHVMPNGEWRIDKGTLIGKKCILIPQTITAGTEILTLHTQSKNYACQLSENYELESGKACELILLFDPQTGISDITPCINDWKEGIKSEITPEEKKEKEKILISDFDFGQSNIYNVCNQGEIVAEVCKEYLSGNGIDAQAIVIYPVINMKSDLSNGTVLKVIGENKNVHGGKVTWNTVANTLSYLPGSQPLIPYFYISSQHSIAFDYPTDPLLLTVQEKMLWDSRGGINTPYHIVKIGTQYWIEENLKATFYNDNKKITLKTTNTYTKTTAGYFMENEHYYYNKAAVTSGKLPPKNWRIANNKDWEKLKTYTSGDASKLKRINSWESNEPHPYDITGFKSVPTGFFTKKELENCSIYSPKEYAIYWNMGDNEKTLSSTNVLLRSDSNEFREAAHSDYSGYSVRCIQKDVSE